MTAYRISQKSAPSPPPSTHALPQPQAVADVDTLLAPSPAPKRSRPKARLTPWQLAVGALALVGGATARNLQGGGPRENSPSPLTGDAAHFLHRHHRGESILCITSLHTLRDAPYADVATENNLHYARSWGYNYFVFRGRISGDKLQSPGLGGIDTVKGGGLVWQKLPSLQTLLEQQLPSGEPLCRWAFWLDADAIFTNFHLSLQEFIDNTVHAGPLRKDVILAKEECGWQNKINSGVIGVKNSVGGREFLRDVMGLYQRYAHRDWEEQSAIHEWVFGMDYNDVAKNDSDSVYTTVRANVALVPQRALNSFKWEQPETPESCAWKRCDFVAHMPGLDLEKRREFMLEMRRATGDC